MKILTYPNPILKTISEPVVEFNKDLKKFINDMVDTMYADDGVGLAAIQVGRPIRAIVVDVGLENECADFLDTSKEKQKHQPNLFKLINPKILEKHGEIKYTEGCLSVPDIREKVTRAKTIKVQAQDEDGNTSEFIADGLLSICIQHEIDHLDGILFVDRLSRLQKEMMKGKLKKLK